MSTNLNIEAERSGKFIPDDRTEPIAHIIREFFDCYQTPTAVTESILQAEDKIQAYKDWVMSGPMNCEEPLIGYEWEGDEILSDEGLVADSIIRFHSPAVEHCYSLDKFLERNKNAKIVIYGE